MRLEDIHIPVGSLAGVGPATAKLFASLNVFTIADLLTLYPRDYDDRTKITKLSQFRQNPKIHTVAKVTAHDWFGYGRMKTLKIFINDGSAEAQLIAFNRPFLEKTYPVGSLIAVSGTFAIKYGSLQSSSFDAIKLTEPGIENLSIAEIMQNPLPDSGVLPVYPLTEGLSQKIVRKAVASALKQCYSGIDSELPESIMKQRGLLSKKDAILLIHQPKTYSDVEKARNTLIYEELFKFQYSMAKRIWEHKHKLPEAALSESPDQNFHAEVPEQTFRQSLSPRQAQLLERLPFALTEGQKTAIYQINMDIDHGFKDRTALLKEPSQTSANSQDLPVYTMSRLLQGDVGSGKTLTAFFACLRTVDLGGQCAVMAPTELLARQHAENAARSLEVLGVRIAFLTGALSTPARRQLLKELQNGNIDILIGTHALFSSNVCYKDLQLVIIDEQHRFGVMQRNAIIGKGLQLTNKKYVSPHLLMMSATPIPQTLALTVFGDLDVSTIKTMPQGRKSVITYLVREGHEQNAYAAVQKELEKGRQAYFVYPAISGAPQQEEDFSDFSADSNSEKKAQTSIKAAEENFKFLAEKVYPQFKCALIHSKIEEDSQIKILNDFREGKIQVLVATTVIEVGVDVPNATCMVIEQADHFGLAQLHQLRGRVGRGQEQSYCFLIYSHKITETGIARMKAIRESTDGFVLAEADLKLRGPGELTGTLQAGNLSLGIADIHRDRSILMQARADAFAFMQRKLQDASSLQDAAFL